MLESFYYTDILFKTTFFLYLASLLVCGAAVTMRGEWIRRASHALFLIAFASCTFLIVSRWIEAGRPPFKSFYESLVFAIWTISFVTVIMEFKYKMKVLTFLANLSILGIFLFALNKRDADVITLPPALQTWLFIPHVISYFLSYGALFVSGLGAILYLVYPGGLPLHPSLGHQKRIDFSEFSYEIAKIGFLFLTAGLLLGAWWGQVAWSNYWGWDPKENWALITWLIFAAYLHFRNVPDMSKRNLSWVLIIGVMAIIFTYLGMEYLPTADSSLHVYSSD